MNNDFVIFVEDEHKEMMGDSLHILTFIFFNLNKQVQGLTQLTFTRHDTQLTDTSSIYCIIH